MLSAEIEDNGIRIALIDNMDYLYDKVGLYDGYISNSEEKLTVEDTDEKTWDINLSMKGDNYEIEEYHFKSSIIDEEDKTTPPNEIVQKKKFGRRRKKDQALKKQGHTKNKKDNRKNKIKTHFLNFIIEFTNGLIKGGLYNIKNIKFRKISHSEKSNTSISANKELLCKKIKDILALSVSTKYRNKSEQNFTNLEKLRERCQKTGGYECFANITNISVKDFYKEFYLADNIQEILHVFQIKRDKSSKLQFFNEFTQKLIDKGEELEYVEELINEAKTFVSEFMEKEPKARIRIKYL